MNIKTHDTTEDRILEAARQTFQNNGFEGTTMQEIADSAKINKAMLHYYFRSKEKLFDKIFQELFVNFLNSVGSIFDTDISYLDKIRLFISAHIDFLIKNPHLPTFIMHEINRNPKLLINAMSLNNDDNRFRKFIQDTLKEIQNGQIKAVDPRHLFINILSLNIFPIVAKPLFMSVLRTDQAGYSDFLEERKTVIFNTIRELLEVK